MHPGQQRLVEGIGQLQRAQAAALQFMFHMVDAGGHLEARHQFAAEHLDFALVQCVLVVVDGEHAAHHAARRSTARRRPEAVSPNRSFGSSSSGTSAICWPMPRSSDSWWM